MKNKKLFLLSSVFLILFSISNSYSQNNSSIKGTVKDKHGKELAGANIKILNSSYGTSTSLDGNYEIKNLPEGSYTLKVSFIGFNTITKKVITTKNETVTVNFILHDSDNILGEITVKGQTLKLRNSVTTVDVISINTIKNTIATAEQPLRLLEQISGINVVAYGQGGIADQFSIRGFNGGHVGGAGMQIDGVSLNEAEGHGDGYSDMGVIIPLNLSRVKVYKGPSSVLFGRYAMGGTVALESRKHGEYKDLSIKGGSFSTLDAQYAQGNSFEVGNDRYIQTNFAVQTFKTDGYMENSDLTKGNVEGRISFPISEKGKLALSFRGHKSVFGAPGYLVKAEYENKDLRRKPNKYAENDGGNKNFFSERIDYSNKINDNVTLLLFGYAVQQDFTRFAKFKLDGFGEQSERFNKRKVYAMGGSVNGNTKLGEKDFDWIAGVELYGESTDRKRWNSSFRVRKDLFLDDYSTMLSLSAFVQGEVTIHKLFKPSIGLRYDTFGGEYHTKNPGKEEKIYTINSLYHVTPKFGFRSTFTDGLDFRASASNGFYLSTGDDAKLKYTQKDIDPTELWQYEIGLSYKNNMVDADVAAFILNSSREVRPDGLGNMVNIGKTARSGVETSLKIKPTKGLSFNSTFAYTKTEIKDGAAKGEAIPQIPDVIFTLGANYVSSIGLGANVDFRHVSDYFVEGDFYAGKYNVTNLTLFYNLDKILSNKGRIYATVNNIFNEYYAETYYGEDFIAPSPTRNFSLGVNYSF